MPPAIREQYQYFTQAKVENLRRAGYNAGFTPLEEAVTGTSPRSSTARPLPVTLEATSSER